jgi:hypothetical protein
MTVGWRNPQEDAYDLTSINIWYNKINYNVLYKCEDGYANGTISSSYYSPTTFLDIFGRHNITIYEWTDFINNTNIKTPIFRAPETNEC